MVRSRTGLSQKIREPTGLAPHLTSMKERLVTTRIQIQPSVRPLGFSKIFGTRSPKNPLLQPVVFKLPVSSWGCHQWSKPIRHV